MTDMRENRQGFCQVPPPQRNNPLILNFPSVLKYSMLNIDSPFFLFHHVFIKVNKVFYASTQSLKSNLLLILKGGDI